MASLSANYDLSVFFSISLISIQKFLPSKQGQLLQSPNFQSVRKEDDGYSFVKEKSELVDELKGSLGIAVKAEGESSSPLLKKTSELKCGGGGGEFSIGQCDSGP